MVYASFNDSLVGEVSISRYSSDGLGQDSGNNVYPGRNTIRYPKVIDASKPSLSLLRFDRSLHLYAIYWQMTELINA